MWGWYRWDWDGQWGQLGAMGSGLVGLGWPMGSVGVNEVGRNPTWVCKRTCVGVHECASVP